MKLNFNRFYDLWWNDYDEIFSMNFSHFLNESYIFHKSFLQIAFMFILKNRYWINHLLWLIVLSLIIFFFLYHLCFHFYSVSIIYKIFLTKLEYNFVTIRYVYSCSSNFKILYYIIILDYIIMIRLYKMI